MMQIEYKTRSTYTMSSPHLEMPRAGRVMIIEQPLLLPITCKYITAEVIHKRRSLIMKIAFCYSIYFATAERLLALKAFISNYF